SFSADAYATGQMSANIDVDLSAQIYAVWHLFSHTWTYKVGSLKKQIGPELKLTLGKIAYGKDGEITWPSISQIKVEPEHIDPLEIVKDLMRSGKAEKTEAGRRAEIEHGFKI